MSLSKKMIIENARSQLNQAKLFEDADLSFIRNMKNLEDVRNAYEKSFNLLSKKKLTIPMVKELFSSFQMYARMLENMAITEVQGSIIDVKSSIKQICHQHSLPDNLKEEKVLAPTKIDLSYYGSALNNKTNQE